MSRANERKILRAKEEKEKSEPERSIRCSKKLDAARNREEEVLSMANLEGTFGTFVIFWF